uniref:Putative ovule protein n=1 Tax=Solanum chacoense TaxID=4108 RepID=A0A0V0GN10_SOLCH
MLSAEKLSPMLRYYNKTSRRIQALIRLMRSYTAILGILIPWVSSLLLSLGRSLRYVTIHFFWTEVKQKLCSGMKFVYQPWCTL